MRRSTRSISCGGLRSPEQLGRDVGEQRRLALALAGLGRLTARPGRQRSDDNGRSQVDGEREPVGTVGEREGVNRGQEEEVEREHARDGDGDRPRSPPEHGDWEHREDEQHAEAENGHPVVEEGDRSRDHRDGECPRQHSGERASDKAAACPHGRNGNAVARAATEVAAVGEPTMTSRQQQAPRKTRKAPGRATRRESQFPHRGQRRH